MPSLRSTWSLSFALLLAGCATSAVDYGQRCDVTLASLEGQPVSPGQPLELIGGPLTSTYDTTVSIGDVDAQVGELLRTDCEACDRCRTDAGCSACNDCDSCDAECTDICVESVTVTVPDLPAGPAALVLYNAYGATQPQTVEVLGESTDTGSDSGQSRSAPPPTER